MTTPSKRPSNWLKLLAHELAHELFRNLDPKTRKSYLDATFWFEAHGGKENLHDQRKGWSASLFDEDGIEILQLRISSNNLEHLSIQSNKIART